MIKPERIISIILLFVIGLSNIATPAAYAVELGKIPLKLPIGNIVTPTGSASTPKFLKQDHGSVLGASTSLLTVGTQELDLREGNAGSAHQRIPIRMQQLEKKVYQTTEDVTLAVTNPDNEAFTTTVQDADGKTVTVPITESNNGTTTNVQLASSNDIKPGKYKIMITDGEKKTTEQDFTWGVLALNTDKSVYHPQDTGDISIAVLNDKGDMVCDAQVQLKVQSAGLTVDDELATTNGKITVNPQCQKHDFSLQPDYEAHYQFGKAGTYNLQLTAITQNGTHTISDSIKVTDKTPFDVQRVSATRIYPPNTYPMTFNVTANRDFSGTVTETVPDNFTITPATQSANQSYTNMQTLYLNSDDPTVKLAQALLSSGQSQLVMPFQGEFPITQGFGAELTDPTLQAFYSHYGLGGHDGIDFGLPIGTPLYAVDEGDIVWSGPGDYGTMVTIQHAWGKTYYGHMSNTSVTVGQHVTKGQMLGYSGMSGEATGPHLHFGMKPNNADMTNGYYGKIDPMPYLPLGHQAQPIGKSLSMARGTNQLTTLSGTNVLGASDSAVPSPSILPTESPSSTPTVTTAAQPQESSASATITPTPAASVDTIQIATPAANENFTVLDKEIQINEQLANNAQITKVKIITWHVDLKKGDSTSLGYLYQTPKVSPQYYLLGPLKFYSSSSNKVIFQEQRTWQIAADDVGIEWFQDNTGPKWNGYSWQYRRKITIDHTKTSNALYDTRPTPTFMESGTDATHGTEFFSGPGFGTYSSDCTVAKTGSCSLKLTRTGGDSAAASPRGGISSTGGRISFYVYFSTFQNTGTDNFLNFQNNTTYAGTPIELTTADKLQCTDGATIGTTVLSATTWYRISLGYTISGTTITYKVYLNGKLEINCGAETLAAAAPDNVTFGSNVQSQTINFDDMYVDNGTDQSDPGDIHITNKRPFANGTANSFGTPLGSAGAYGTGNARYVNEQPLNTTNGLQSSNNIGQSEAYTLEGNSVGDVDVSKATLLSDDAWAYVKASGACATASIINGSALNTSNLSLTTSNAMYTYMLNSGSYPSGGYGVGFSSCSAGTTSLGEIGTLIAYIPATSASYTTTTPIFMESGGDATNTNGGSNFTTTTGGFYASTSIGAAGSSLTTDCTLSHTGPCSIKATSAGSPGTKASVATPTLTNTSSGRVTGYFYFDSLPGGASAMPFLALQSAGGGNVVDLELEGGGDKLKFNTIVGTTGQTVLQAGTWYRVSLVYSITSATVNQFIVYMNGKEEINLVNTTLSPSAVDHYRIGNLDNVDASTTMHFDDIYSDNSANLIDPGDIRVTAKRPLSNGALNQFTANGSPSGFPSGATGNAQYVSEESLNTGANVSVSLANKRENYTLESASQGDVDISSAGIIANDAWAYAKTGSNCTGQITNNGVDSNISLVSTGDTMFTSIGTNANFLSGNQGVGIQSCTSTQTVTLEEAGMLIAYTPNNPGNTLTNFPLLVSLTSDSDLNSHAQGSGNDIVFTDSTGRTKLNHEIENYNAGTLQAWVQVPSLSTTTDTIIYMYYGNPAASNQQTASSVWSGYSAVWHMNENTTTIADSTIDADNGTKTNGATHPTQTTGQIFDAQSYGGTNTDTVNVGDPSNNSLDFNISSFSFSCWVKVTTSNGAFDMPIFKDGASPASPGYDMELGTGVWNSHVVGGGVTATAQFSATELNDSTWHYLVATVDRGTSVLTPYLDGVEGTPVSIATVGSSSNATSFALGNSGAFPFEGLLDEARVAQNSLTPGWVSTDYNNINSPGTFAPVNTTIETNIYAPTLDKLMRHGQWFDSAGTVQPFNF